MMVLANRQQPREPLRRITERPLQGVEINPNKEKGSKTTARGQKRGLRLVMVKAEAGW